MRSCLRSSPDASPAAAVPPDRSRWTRWAGIATVVWGALIAVATLRPAGVGTGGAATFWCLACGDQGGADVVRNVLLFLPFGAGLVLAGVRPWRAAAAGLLLSSIVEAAQLLVVDGRAATLSDLAANTLGALAGSALGNRRALLVRPSPSQARRLATVAALCFAAVSALGAWLVHPAIPSSGLRVMEFPPRPNGLRAFEGQVLQASLDGRDVASSPGARDAGSALRADAVTATATVRTTYPPGTPRPIVFAFSQEWDEAVVLAQRQRNLMLALGSPAARLRLRNLRFELREAFPIVASPSRAPATTAHLRVADGMVWMRSEGLVHEREVRLPLSPHYLWAYFLGPVPITDRTVFVGAIWLTVLLLPVGYWQRLGSTIRMGRLTSWAPASGVLVTLLAAPALVGLASPAWWEWVGAGCGLALGWTIGGVGGGRARGSAVTGGRRTRHS